MSYTLTFRDVLVASTTTTKKKEVNFPADVRYSPVLKHSARKLYIAFLWLSVIFDQNVI